jgi:hypothetical protein
VSRDEGVALHVRSIRRGEVIRTAAVLRLGTAGTVLLVRSLRPQSCHFLPIFPGRCGIKWADWKKFAHYVNIMLGTILNLSSYRKLFITGSKFQYFSRKITLCLAAILRLHTFY